MEPGEIFLKKIEVFGLALQGLKEAMEIDDSTFTEVVKDAIDNGKIQKFEYSVELCWKLIKRFLDIKHGLDVPSPKQSVKELFLSGEVNEGEYELMLQMIDDRNRLSHIYRREIFQEILSCLPGYYNLMNRVLAIVSDTKIP